jgi:KDO2-lipid IV(A) lauroyltransferase
VLIWKSYPLGWLVWKLSPTKRNSTIKNLKACYPDMNESARMKLARESMRHYVCNALETGKAWHWSKERMLRQFDEPIGLEHLEAARAGGSGVLALVPHFGAWEFSTQGFEGAEVLALYKPGAHQEFDEKLLEKRLRQGTHMAATDQSGLKTVYRQLRDSGIVVQLPDQEPSRGQGRFVPFFGIPAWTGILAPRLIQRTGCKALFVVCRRTRMGRFQMVFIPPGESIYSADLDTALAAVNRGVEQCVEVETEQYLWAYKRFKTRPEGEPRFYR